MIGSSQVIARDNTEPAKLTKFVRGELDWIVMKALEKDRSRSYETVETHVAAKAESSVAWLLTAMCLMLTVRFANTDSARTTEVLQAAGLPMGPKRWWTQLIDWWNRAN